MDLVPVLHVVISVKVNQDAGNKQCQNNKFYSIEHRLIVERITNMQHCLSLVWVLMTLWSAVILILLCFIGKGRVHWLLHIFGLDYKVKAWEK